MRFINENDPPQSLIQWKASETAIENRRYDDGSLPSKTKEDIREARVKDQYFLCAYTMREIREITWNGQLTWDAHIEHVISQESSRNRFEQGDKHAYEDTIDYDNMLACVDRGATLPYGASKRGSKELKVHPLQNNCQRRFRYNLAGKVEGLTEDAKEVIEILNLNHSSLVDLRRARMASLGIAIRIPKTPGRKTVFKVKRISAAKARRLAADILHPVNGKLTEFCVAIAHCAEDHARRTELDFTS